MMVDTERERTAKLQARLDEALDTVGRHAARSREFEAALKVTQAEITELKTARRSPKKIAQTTTGMGESKWAAKDGENGVAAEAEAAEGADEEDSNDGRGHAIEGSVRDPLSYVLDRPGRFSRVSSILSVREARANVLRMAQMAGLQAQIKLLENINEDMIGDHQR